MSLLHRLLPAALLFAATAQAATAQAATAQAATVWDEATQGDLSGNGLAPTALTLQPGSNLLLGSTGRGSAGVDRDYFVFTLAEGLQLDALTLLDGSTFLGQQSLSFIGVQAGPQVTVNPTGGSATGLLGWHHYGPNDLGTDILPLIGFGLGATGFLGPLPAGTYAFWIQDTGSGTANYRFDFAVSAVPEPALAWMWAAGLAALALRRRR